MRAISYIRRPRIATRVDLVSASINLQKREEELRSHAAWFQLTVCDTVIESSSSTDTLERHGLQLTLRRMKELEARSLLVNCLTDLTTYGADLQSLLDSYFTKGFTLFCGTERIRSDKRDGWVYLERKCKQLELITEGDRG